MNKQLAYLSSAGLILFLVVAGFLLNFHGYQDSEKSVPHQIETETTFTASLPSIQSKIYTKTADTNKPENRHSDQQATAIKPTNATTDETVATAVNSMEFTDTDGKQRALDARRTSLENVDLLRTFINDPNPAVREATLSRYLDLEAEHEVDNNITRRPNESGRFTPRVLENLSIENDNFVLAKSLDYLGEYGGQGDSNIESSLQKLLQNPNLSTDTLSRVGELLMDNNNMPLDQVKETIQKSPSVQQLPESELIYLQRTLDKLNNGNLSNVPGATVTSP